MSASSLDTLFQQARPPARSLEIDQVVATLHERFGCGEVPPVTIGRYRVAGRLGAGGLGIVYRAFDPVLARYVAIKVLKGGREAAEHDVRLLHEAQVLARIRHPHVVEVFDVGFFEDHGLAAPHGDTTQGAITSGLTRFFVAMELVEGTDMRGWLAPGRSLAQIVETFAAAAEGLAAAHAAGLLHRDFKPGNVLMGEDGAVKVADFGLAAVTQELRAEPATAGGSLVEATLSWRPGGTLHYMSPEQQRGEPLTPASDQFGLCVSLYEAIYGERPFEGHDRHEILAAKERGPSLPRTPLAPAALRRLLARGLAVRPDDRFESVTTLRQALLRVRTSARRRWQAVAGLSALTVGAAIGATTLATEPELVAPPCPSPPPTLHEGPVAATPAVEAVLRRSPPLARAWPRLAEALDAYAAELRTRWDDACSLPPPQRDRVHRCLSQGSDGLHALRELLLAGDRDALTQGWQLVLELPQIQACAAERDPVHGHGGALEAGIARARMLATAGRLDAARQVLQALQVELSAPADAHDRRRVDIELAELEALDGHHEQAKQSLERLYFEAVGADDALEASRAAVWLVAQGYRTGDVDGARQWSRAARTRLDRVQPRRHDLETMLGHNLALLELAAGRLAQALTTSQRALVHASEPGVSPKLRRAVEQVYAELLMLNGRPAEALAIHRDRLRTDAPHGGQGRDERDPLAAVVDLQSLGNARMTLHDVDGAWTAYRDALELGRALLGPEHPDTAAACISFAWAEGDRGKPARARELLAPCLRHLVDTLGEDHPHVAIARGMDGRLASQDGRPEEARRLLEGALASLERSFGESHYTVGDVLHELGLALAAAGDLAGARRTLERALRVRRASLPAGHVYVAETQAELARLHAAAGEREQARALLTQAIASFEARQLEPAYVEGWRERLHALDDPDAPGPAPHPTEPEP